MKPEIINGGDGGRFYQREPMGDGEILNHQNFGTAKKQVLNHAEDRTAD